MCQEKYHRTRSQYSWLFTVDLWKILFDELYNSTLIKMSCSSGEKLKKWFEVFKRVNDFRRFSLRLSRKRILVIFLFYRIIFLFYRTVSEIKSLNPTSVELYFQLKRAARLSQRHCMILRENLGRGYQNFLKMYEKVASCTSPFVRQFI